jgi:hypothetical protein
VYTFSHSGFHDTDSRSRNQNSPVDICKLFTFLNLHIYRKANNLHIQLPSDSNVIELNLSIVGKVGISTPVQLYNYSKLKKGESF